MKASGGKRNNKLRSMYGKGQRARTNEEEGGGGRRTQFWRETTARLRIGKMYSYVLGKESMYVHTVSTYVSKVPTVGSYICDRMVIQIEIPKCIIILCTLLDMDE